jgi:spermidine synthase
VNNINIQKISTLLAFTLLGCYAVVVQVLFIREFMVVFFGSELCLGIIFSSWLVGISLGAGAGAKFIKRFKRILPIFIIIQVIICIAPFLQIYCIRTIREILNIPPGEYTSLVQLIVSTFLLILPFSFMIGVTFPYACKLNVVAVKNKAHHIGRVYIFEAIGGLIGGVLLTFYMIPHFKPYEIASIISLLILVNCIILSLSHKGILRGFFLIFTCLLFSLLSGYLLISGKASTIDDFLINKRWDAYKNRLEMITSRDSLYQNIVVALKEEQYSLFSNGQYVFSFPDPYQSAVFAHFVLSQHPNPRKILLVGGGTAGIVKEMLKHPLTLLHYVELDPALIEAYLPYLPDEDKSSLEDTRVKLFYTDGRYFIKNAQENYDMVIVNLPDPSTAMLNRFYTLEFFEEVKERLNDGGVLVTGITSAENYIGQETGVYAGSLYQTLKEVFPFIVIAPGGENYFFASSTPNVVTADNELLRKRYRDLEVSSDYFTPYHFTMLLPEERVAFIKKSLKNMSEAQVNTDAHPTTYFYNLVLWGIFSGGRGEGTIFQYFSGGVYWFIFPLAILFLIRLFYVSFKKERSAHHLKFNALLAIATTGFAGMALEIILLFAFQNIYGYVYQKVGMIVALFMAGLALGGYLMNRLIAGKERNWIKMLFAFECLIGVYAISLPYIISFCSSHITGAGSIISLEYLFMLLVVGAGWLTGLEFPLVSRIIINQEEVGTVAGWVDSFDHLGACFGALLTGTILIPLLGTSQSCLFTGALNFISAFLLMIYLLQKR